MKKPRKVKQKPRSVKQKVDLKDAWLTWALIRPGIAIYALFVPDYPTPLGLVWGYRQGGKKVKFCVHGSYVPAWARRSGIRRKMNEKIFETNHASVIVSGDSTPEGKAFMEATGYKYNAKADWWILTAPRKRST